MAAARFGVPAEALAVSAAVISVKGDPSRHVTYGDLIGARGRLSLDAEGFRLITFESENLRSKPPVTRIERISPNWTVSGIQAALLDLIAAMETGRPTASSPETARRTVAITQAILESQARGNVPVRVAPPPAATVVG